MADFFNIMASHLGSHDGVGVRHKEKAKSPFFAFSLCTHLVRRLAFFQDEVCPNSIRTHTLGEKCQKARTEVMNPNALSPL